MPLSSPALSLTEQSRLGQSALGGNMSGSLKLRILATTDLHAHLLRYDYLHDTATSKFGLEGLVDVIRAAALDCDAAILVDNGDLLQGSLMGEIAEDHPMVEALNLLGYTAATAGNHDFNFGLTYLEHAVSQSHFTWVNANITERATAQPPAGMQRHLIHQLDLSHKGLPPLNIGITGAAPPQILNWDAQLYYGALDIEDSQTALLREAQIMHEAGADLKIALCHFGVSDAAPEPNCENPARAVAATRVFDGLVLGHTHQLCPTVQGATLETPSVMAGYFGSHLGILEYAFDLDEDGWVLRSGAARLVPAQPPSAAHFAEHPQINQAHQRTLRALRQEICPNDTPTRAHFTEVGVDPIWPIIASSQLEWAQAQPALSDRPILAAIAPIHIARFKDEFSDTVVRGAGVQMRHIQQLVPYPNTLAVIPMTGAQIIAYLERAASYFAPLAHQTLRAQQAAYNFDALFGITYDINIDAPPRYDGLGRLHAPDAQRIENVMYQGRPLRLDQEFWVITNHHRAGGGGQFPNTGPQASLDLNLPPVKARDVLTSYLQTYGLWCASRHLPFRVTSRSDTPIRLDITAGAAEHLHQIAHLSPQVIDQTTGAGHRSDLCTITVTLPKP